MYSELGKNLWILLTLVIPGLFTYGAWRLILILEPSHRLTAEVLSKIDDSAFVSSSIIVTIALAQQAGAIVIETLLTVFVKLFKKKCPNLHTLFCKRFAMSANGQLDENATRVIGNFFLSTNTCIGMALLLFYFLAYESMTLNSWIPLSLLILLSATLVTSIFRMINAKWVIEDCIKRSSKSIFTK